MLDSLPLDIRCKPQDRQPSGRRELVGRRLSRAISAELGIRGAVGVGRIAQAASWWGQCLGRIFVSHASGDKTERVKPLVRALLIERVPLWLDRPGYGESHFNFDAAYIERHDIVGLQAGRPFDRQILEAHWQSDAVLGCLSRQLTEDRHVLVQEFVLATYANKLVTCIVDDLPYGDIPTDLGLIDPSRLQAPRVDPHALREASDLLESSRCEHPDELPADLFHAWETVRQLIADIHSVSGQKRLPRLNIEDAQVLRARLLVVPIGPMVRPHEIPDEIIIAFGSQLARPDASRRHLQMSMQLVLSCNPELFDPRQIVVTDGEVSPPETNPPENYWAEVLIAAGIKSRRSLAALLCAPTGLRIERLPTATVAVLEHFLVWLRDPHPRQSD